MKTEYSAFGMNDFSFTYTVELYNSTNIDLSSSVKTISEIYNLKRLEVTLRTELPYESEVYTDNGLSLQKW
jgi:hypothetical protein